MTVFALGIFIFCFWAVFSPRINDGIVAKHFFTVGAITAALALLDQQNKVALFSTFVLVICGITAWYFKNRKALHSGQTMHPRRRMTDA